MPDPRIDPFLMNYKPSELRIASEFLTTWLPFLSRGLCGRCTSILSRRIHALESPEFDRIADTDDGSPSVNNDHSPDLKDTRDHDDTCDTHSLGSWKDGCHGDDDGGSGECWQGQSSASPRDLITESSHDSIDSSRNRLSWADMAQEEDELNDEEAKVSGQHSNGKYLKVDSGSLKPKVELSREKREHIRFSNVRRKKDFICLERVNCNLVNILEGLELHEGIFSAAEQKRIVNFIYEQQEMGKNGQLKERTYTAPRKWMRGKGRVTIQYGCCYNYIKDNDGNPPGILQSNQAVDPLPNLFKTIIKRLVRWHVIPTTCIPDSCIVNIYEEGDCIPPHIDNHDFLRPFCTVSFLNECNILFGSNLKITSPGEFVGSFSIPLPLGSVLVLNGNGADVAKHCVPAVPKKRISITFRRMDESKRPVGFVPEPDLQGIQPLAYEDENSSESNSQTPKSNVSRVQTHRRPVAQSQPPRIQVRSIMPNERKGEHGMSEMRRHSARGGSYLETRYQPSPQSNRRLG